MNPRTFRQQNNNSIVSKSMLMPYNRSSSPMPNHIRNVKLFKENIKSNSNSNSNSRRESIDLGNKNDNHNLSHNSINVPSIHNTKYKKVENNKIKEDDEEQEEDDHHYDHDFINKNNDLN